MYRLLAEDIIKFHKIIEEHQFLINHDFKTEGDVLNFLSESKSEIAELTEARRMLRNELKRAVRAENTDEKARLKYDIECISFRMNRLRKDLAICYRIGEKEPQIEEKLHDAEKIYERNRIVNGK